MPKKPGLTPGDPIHWDSWFFDQTINSPRFNNPLIDEPHIDFTSALEPPMKTEKWVVLMHSPGVGTFAPYFTSIDEAEEFSNAMRVITDDAAVSEPIPVIKTETKSTVYIKTNQELKRPNPFHAIQT